MRARIDKGFSQRLRSLGFEDTLKITHKYR